MPRGDFILNRGLPFNENAAVYHRLNVTTNLSGVVVPISGGNTTNSEFLVPAAGQIRGLTVYLNADMGTGTLNVWPTVNGTTKPALKCHFNAATVGIKRQVQALAASKGAVPLAAFDRVGVKITSSANFAPVTIDLLATIHMDY